MILIFKPWTEYTLKMMFLLHLKALSHYLLALMASHKPVVIHRGVLFSGFAFWIFPLSPVFCTFIVTWKSTGFFHWCLPMFNVLLLFGFSETLGPHLLIYTWCSLPSFLYAPLNSWQVDLHLLVPPSVPTLSSTGPTFLLPHSALRNSRRSMSFTNSRLRCI